MKAQQIDMFLVGLGTDMALGHAHFYAAGGVTNKDIYTTKTKTATLSNPYTLDATGKAAAVIYADGWYKITAHKADGTLFATWDQLYYGVLEQTDARSGANTAVADTYTVLATDDVIECNASSAGFTVTLIDATTITDHKRYTIKKVDATTNTVTVDGTGSQTIDGATTRVLSRQWEAITVMLNDAGTGWLIEEAFDTSNADKLDDHDASHTPTANTIPISEAAAITLDTGWIPNYLKMLCEATDTTPEYLDGKVDDSTIEAYATSHYIRVKASGITTAQLKNSSYEASSAAIQANVAVTGGEWCHWPQVRVSASVGDVSVAGDLAATSYATIVSLSNDAGGTTYAKFLYHTSSGEQMWIFRLIDKATKKTLITTVGIDHPCFSSSGDPKTTPHCFPSYDPDKHEILVCTPTIKEIEQTIDSSGDKSLLEVINDDYDLIPDEKAPWPDQPVAVRGREDPFTHKIVTTKKVVITKESYLIPCRLEKNRAKTG